MKKIFALALFAVMAISASAQLYVGGSLKAWRDGTDHVTTAAILPEIGYTYSDQWAFGTVIGWDHTHETGITTNLFKIEPYARLTYFKSGIVGLFVDGGFGLGFGKTKFGGESSDTATTWNIGFQPGVSLAVSEHCSFVAHFGFLGYKGANDAAKEGGHPDEWGLNFSGNDLKIGFYYNF